jgi:hypothetical protein
LGVGRKGVRDGYEAFPSEPEVRREVGREPGPDDPIFFDVDEDKVREDTADAMRAAGISPALIYAYEETGLIVTQENRRPSTCPAACVLIFVAASKRMCCSDQSGTPAAAD